MESTKVNTSRIKPDAFNESRTRSYSFVNSANPIRLGRQIRVSGTVVKGSLVKLADDQVCLQRKEKSGWNALRCVTIGADGKFGTRYEPGSRVDYSYRWFTGGGREYGDGTSPARVLRVN